MAAQIVDVVFYDGVVSKPWAAKISPIDAQSVLIRYGENLEQQRRYHYQDMMLVGALGKINLSLNSKMMRVLNFPKPCRSGFNCEINRCSIPSGNWNARQV